MNRSPLKQLEKGASYPGLEIIAKLATVLEVEPTELLVSRIEPSGAGVTVHLAVTFRPLFARLRLSLKRTSLNKGLPERSKPDRSKGRRSVHSLKRIT
jgi:transcriptional regulator with XRE-family HTH domain